MKRLPIISLFCAAVCCLPAGLHAKNCSGLPIQFTGNQFPTGNFFTNFDNSCYLIPIPSGSGAATEEGDLNSVYNQLFFNISPSFPPYELILLGQFPNARYFSVGLYDNHSAPSGNLTDVNIVPLTASDINPFEPGVSFVSGQRYGASIHLGGTPGVEQTGCMMTGYNVEDNWMDGTQRHEYMNWNLNTAFLDQGIYAFHDVDTPTHSNPNPAGVVLIRSYLDLTAATQANQPYVIVRDIASGCAYPAAYVTGTMDVITTSSTVGTPWLDQDQVQEHSLYASYQSTNCWGLIEDSAMQWLREDEYTPGSNEDSAYLVTYVPAGLPQTMATAGEVFLIKFRVPTTPPTPCVNGCSRSGSEQMRYFSISFQIPGGGTLASLPDSCPLNPVIPCIPLVQDPNGYVSLVVGTGTPQPPQATAANGYTWLDLSQVGNPDYLELNEIDIRDILPSSWYECGTQEVPYKVSQATTKNAGLMGLYSPVISTTLTAATLPTTATPLTGPSTCAQFPDGVPQVNTQGCAVLTFPAIAISALTTQCSQQQIQTGGGCNQIVVQATPPISILGTGFGSFPLGLPYNGNSNFIEIEDITQNWSAGYTGNTCSVSVGEWSDTLISVVANVNSNGVCPMQAGDQLTVTVTNPQTLKYATFPITVTALQGGFRKPSH